jgi:hypothetical protein
MRLSLHPRGLAPRILNHAQWRSHLLARLHQQIETSGDATLRELLGELLDYPAPATAGRQAPGHGAADSQAVVVPLELAAEGAVLRFFGTITIFGTPVDITLSELAIETFFPADEATAAALRRTAEALKQAG